MASARNRRHLYASDGEKTNTPNTPTSKAFSFFHLDGLVVKRRPQACLTGVHSLLYQRRLGGLLLFVGCLTSQQHASISQGRISSDSCTCCRTEIEVADQTFYFTQSQYTDTGPTSPSADPITPGAWQGSHWSVNF